MSRAPRINEAPPEFTNEIQARAWERGQDLKQRKLDAAWDKYPPGTKLHVSSARGLSTRTRAGVTFSAKASTEVEVVEGSDAEVLARVTRGQAVVSPIGAAAIVGDNGLIVHGGPRTTAMQAAADDELAKLKADLAAAKAELARAQSSESNDGRPTRLGKAGKDAAGKDAGKDDPATTGSTIIPPGPPAK